MCSRQPFYKSKEDAAPRPRHAVGFPVNDVRKSPFCQDEGRADHSPIYRVLSALALSWLLAANADSAWATSADHQSSVNTSASVRPIPPPPGLKPNVRAVIPNLPPVEHVDAAETPSGQPIPRFVSIRGKEVNLRQGPGTRYPIKWVYRAPGFPVEVIAEYDNWRKIRDYEGADGWVHRSMIAGARSVLTLNEDQILRAKPSAESRPLLRLGPRVTAFVLACPEETTFCRVTVRDRSGWLPRNCLWGVYPGEVIE